MFTPFRNDGVKFLAKLRPFFLEESNLVTKVRKIVGLRVHFLYFLCPSLKFNTNV